MEERSLTIGPGRTGEKARETGKKGETGTKCEKEQTTNLLSPFVLSLTIHNDINFLLFVIPGLTPHQVRGRPRNPVSFWIPAFAGMTRPVPINVVMYK
jgi:hypothetical protein